jgi:casein kinase I family protein HRR25
MYGTTIFLSLNVMKGIEQTRKDELESLGLVIIYLYQGFLPWSEYKCKEMFQLLDKIRNLKLKITNEELCKNLPKEIYDYMNYVKNMNFDDNPDYTYLQSLFLNILTKIGEKNDLMFSWVDKNEEPRKISSRNNSKSLQKIYKNIFLAHSNKEIPISNSDIGIKNSFDNQRLNQEIFNKVDVMDLKKHKKKKNCVDNNNNVIYWYNNNEKKINYERKIIHHNFLFYIGIVLFIYF